MHSGRTICSVEFWIGACNAHEYHYSRRRHTTRIQTPQNCHLCMILRPYFSPWLQLLQPLHNAYSSSSVLAFKSSFLSPFSRSSSRSHHIKFHTLIFSIQHHAQINFDAYINRVGSDVAQNLSIWESTPSHILKSPMAARAFGAWRKYSPMHRGSLGSSWRGWM